MATKKATKKGAAPAAPAMPLPRVSNEFAEAVAKSLKADCARIATQIEATGVIGSDVDRAKAARALRAYAALIPTKQKRARGRPQVVDHGEVLGMYAVYRAEGRSKTAAIARIAEVRDVDSELIRHVVHAHGDAALEFYQVMPKKT